MNIKQISNLFLIDLSEIMKIVSLTFHPYLASIINNNEVLDEKNNNNNAETTIDQLQSGKPETGSKRKLAVEAKIKGSKRLTWKKSFLLR